MFRIDDFSMINICIDKNVLFFKPKELFFITEIVFLCNSLYKSLDLIAIDNHFAAAMNSHDRFTLIHIRAGMQEWC